MMPSPRFVRAYPPAAAAVSTADAFYLPFCQGELLLPDRPTLALPHDLNAFAPLPGTEPLYLGTWDDTPCFAAECFERPAGWRGWNLRSLYGQTDDALYGIAGYAAQLLHWQRTSRFCPACGHRTQAVENAWARQCEDPDCGYLRYPEVSPATLILVHDGGDKILLAQKPGWGKRYSILAGFVEPGETLEECAARETQEEAGIQISEIRYAGSQPWPYPHQIMVGFTARWTSGQIKIDEDELCDARWFRANELPELPPPLSLSRQLIDQWANSQIQSQTQKE